MSIKTLWQTALTDVARRDKEGVGKLRFASTGEAYRWVLQSEAAATDLAEGDVAFHKFSDGADMHKKVYKALTANLGIMAGVVMGSALVGGGSDVDTNTLASYGWIQVLGYNASAKVFASQTTVKTAGDTLLGVNAAVYVDADTTMGTAPKYTHRLLLLEAVATVTPGAAAAHKVWVQCLQ